MREHLPAKYARREAPQRIERAERAAIPVARSRKCASPVPMRCRARFRVRCWESKRLSAPSSMRVAERGGGFLAGIAKDCQYLFYMYSIHMDERGYIEFEWDERKAASNRTKHGVAVEEARDAFFDPYARVIDDPDHSDDEEPFILIGASMAARVLTVCHCLRAGGSSIRIISARKATKGEEREYWRWRR